MNHSICTPIDKLMYWRAGSWVKHESNSRNLSLRIHYDQLLLTADTKILESLSMSTKLKGFYRDDILILIVSNTRQEIRKLKFQVKSNMAECLSVLGQHFPVVNHSSGNAVMSSRYRDIDEVLRCAAKTMEGKERTLQMPETYSNFVKLCLLDPTFPEVVLETEKILQDEILKE